MNHPTELEIFPAVFYKHCAPTERETVSRLAEGLDTVMPKQKQNGQLRETRELPPGVKLVRTIKRQANLVVNIAFDPAFDLILNIHKIAHHDPAVADLRESLREWEMR